MLSARPTIPMSSTSPVDQPIDRPSMYWYDDLGNQLPLLLALAGRHRQELKWYYLIIMTYSLLHVNLPSKSLPNTCLSHTSKLTGATLMQLYMHVAELISSSDFDMNDMLRGELITMLFEIQCIIISHKSSWKTSSSFGYDFLIMYITGMSRSFRGLLNEPGTMSTKMSMLRFKI